ncbi:hypothetical protein BGZ81_005842 [Podila clonocystis]|nr:hypothetical protein BGZ81_005842 [Podila clonocystis]
MRSAIRALRENVEFYVTRYCTAILIGGVQSNVEHIMLNNVMIKAKFMYHCADPTVLLGIVDAGLLSSMWEIKALKLEEINEAIDWVANNAGPFSGAIVVS